MDVPGLTRCTPEEYLAFERASEFKHEYIDGRVIEAHGASVAHNDITGNLAAELRMRFRGGACRVYSCLMRVKLGDAYVYPDVVAVCGERRFTDGMLDTLTNPVLIAEVLSPTTEAYDRGEKFRHYRTIDSLREYVLIAPHQVLVERFVRHGDVWILSAITEIDRTLDLTSVGCSIPLREIYENVEFPSAAVAEPAE